MHPNIKKFHGNIEITSCGFNVFGLIAMSVANPSVYTQVGIVFWGLAQCILAVWWQRRMSSAYACLAMGVLNLSGSAAFLTGSIVNASWLGCAISVCYIASSLLQCAGGVVRMFQKESSPAQRVLTQLLAKKILIVVSSFQAAAAMGFIVLSPLAGMCYTTAAFLGLMINALVYQCELDKQENDLSVADLPQAPNADSVATRNISPLYARQIGVRTVAMQKPVAW